MTEAFYEKPDRAANANDQLLDWENHYAVQWDKAVKKGDVYLRSIFYSDPLKDTVLKESKTSVDMHLYSADDDGERVGLNGVSNMPYNNFGGGTEGTINSIEDVFTMVEEARVCVTNSGNTTKFWWNPQIIYGATGQKRNISEMTNALQAGLSCIG